MFADLLQKISFQPTRADQDLWYRKLNDYEGYDFIATHFNDILIVAKKTMDYTAQIKQSFKLRDVIDSPEQYFGNKISHCGGKIHVSTKKYISEVLRKYQLEHRSLRKENILLGTKEHPELDKTPLCDEKDHKHYQFIIRVYQLLIVSGRFNLCYAVSSLSSFSCALRKIHLVLAKKMLGYLKKYPKRGYVINSTPLDMGNTLEKIMAPKAYWGRFSYFKEDISPIFSTPLLKELKISIFCYSDHGHDKATG